jgi:hypothetical protein
VVGPGRGSREQELSSNDIRIPWPILLSSCFQFIVFEYSALILPAAVGSFRIALGVGDRDQKSMLRQRAGISYVQKLPLVRDARGIDFIVANIKPIETGGNTGDHFIPLGFDSDDNVVSCDGSTVLNGKSHTLTSLLIGEYTSLRATE